MGTPRDKSLNACIWVRRWLIWSGVKETGVCGDCGGGWTGWLREWDRDLRDIRRGAIDEGGVAICQLTTGVACKRNVGGK
jgi:hypothetical protein